MALMRDLPKRLVIQPAMGPPVAMPSMRGRSQTPESVGESPETSWKNCGRLYMSPSKLVVLISVSNCLGQTK
jgi:hypothetical protein